MIRVHDQPFMELENWVTIERVGMFLPQPTP